MQLRFYTDDGYIYHESSLYEDEIENVKLIEMLHDKGLLTTSEATELLPLGFEAVEVSFM